MEVEGNRSAPGGLEALPLAVPDTTPEALPVDDVWAPEALDPEAPLPEAGVPADEHATNDTTAIPRNESNRMRTEASLLITNHTDHDP
jgi:hypothetical protein